MTANFKYFSTPHLCVCVCVCNHSYAFLCCDVVPEAMQQIQFGICIAQFIWQCTRIMNFVRPFSVTPFSNFLSLSHLPEQVIFHMPLPNSGGGVSEKRLRRGWSSAKCHKTVLSLGKWTALASDNGCTYSTPIHTLSLTHTHTHMYYM